MNLFFENWFKELRTKGMKTTQGFTFSVSVWYKQAVKFENSRLIQGSGR